MSEIGIVVFGDGSVCLGWVESEFELVIVFLLIELIVLYLSGLCVFFGVVGVLGCVVVVVWCVVFISWCG